MKIVLVLLSLLLVGCNENSAQQYSELKSILENIDYKLDEVESQMSDLEDELLILESELSSLSYEEWENNGSEAVNQFSIVLEIAYDLQAAIDELALEVR